MRCSLQIAHPARPLSLRRHMHQTAGLQQSAPAAGHARPRTVLSVLQAVRDVACRVSLATSGKWRTGWEPGPITRRCSSPQGDGAWRKHHTVFTNAKAGMDKVDHDHVQRVVYEMSKVRTSAHIQ